MDCPKLQSKRNRWSDNAIPAKPATHPPTSTQAKGSTGNVPKQSLQDCKQGLACSIDIAWDALKAYKYLVHSLVADKLHLLAENDSATRNHMQAKDWELYG